LLAYVQGGGGIKLESYLGRSVGVSGQRFHRTGVPLELIVIRNLAPVQLAPPAECAFLDRFQRYLAGSLASRAADGCVTSGMLTWRAEMR